MIGQRKKLVISLTPTSLKGATVRGSRIVQAERVAIDASLWNQAWDQNFVPLDRHLRQLLARFAADAGRPEITLIYCGSQTVVQAHEIPGSKDDARRAALLKARESVGASFITDGVVLAKSAGKASHWIVLTISDRDDQTNKLYAWINRCGGQAVALIPEAACVAEAAARRVLTSDEVTACCFMGHGWSAITCGSSSGLHLVRGFEFGHRVISDVFQRALDPEGVAEDRDLGERAMFESGLPFKSSLIPEDLRKKVLPLVAPVLQRFCVEVKQTLRFGMPAGAAPSTLLLDGPGACIGHLPASVTETINMHVRLAPGLEPQTTQEPFGNGSTERACALAPARGIQLIPGVAIEFRTTRLLTRALVGGTLAAGVLLASELAYTIHRERSLEPAFARIAPRLAALTREEDMRAQIQDISTITGAVAAEVVAMSGPTPDWAAVLASIAAIANGHIVFDEIDAHAGPSGGEMRLRGACSGANDAEVSAVMTEMMRRLQVDPTVLSVEQGSTNRELAPDGSVIRSFTITLSVRPVPMPYEALAALAEAHSPSGEGVLP